MFRGGPHEPLCKKEVAVYEAQDDVYSGCLVAVVALLDTFVGVAVAEATRTTQPVRATIPDNPCTEATDPINFSGTADILTNVRQDATGAFILLA